MNEENLNIRWKQRFENYQKALITLQKVIKQTEEDSCGQDNQEMHEMALIQAFEFVFELGWKTMKDFLRAEGYEDVISPRKVIKQCFTNEYIRSGEVWLKALEDRNRTTHTYDENKIKQIVDNIREEYLEIFIELDNFLKVK